jgi:filamentous hemagglutinin
MPNTNGFKPGRLIEHFEDHHAKFSNRPANPQMYKMMADAFFGPRPVAVAEGERRNGDLIRYDPSTEHFGIIDRNRRILTFFPADPAYRVVQMSNAEYFIGEIKK